MTATPASCVFSIDKVSDEIATGNDDLTDWARQATGLFLPTDTPVTAQFGRVSNWIQQQQYEPAAVSDFLSTGADYYLIARALASGYVIVTHEESAPNSRRTIKIPDVCRGLNLCCMNPFTMLRQEGARFVLESQAS